MITEEQFTPEIKAKIPEYIDRALCGVFDGGRYRDFKYDNAKKAVDYIYEFCKYKAPLVLVAENPYEAHIMYYDLCKKHNFEVKKNMEYIGMYLFCLNVYSDSYFTFYKFIQDEFNIETTGNAALLDTFYELQRNSGVFAAIFAEDVCIISKYPIKINRDEENRLHDIEGVAVEWNYTKEPKEYDYTDNGKEENIVFFENEKWQSVDGDSSWKCYYIHGRNVPADFYEKVRSGNYTADEFVKETNEELRGAAYEILGEEKIIELLGAETIDRGVITHENGDMETVALIKTKQKFEGLENQPLAWVKFVCPSTEASYLISVEPHHTDAKEAAMSTSPFYGLEINDEEDYRFKQRT